MIKVISGKERQQSYITTEIIIVDKSFFNLTVVAVLLHLRFIAKTARNLNLLPRMIMDEEKCIMWNKYM